MHDDRITRLAAVSHTRWTRVCLAKETSEDGQRALAELCEAYYEPVVAYLRCELRDAAAARELGHGFFVEILGGGRIQYADPSRGRFRSYLLGAGKYFAARHRQTASRQKRGGGIGTVPLMTPKRWRSRTRDSRLTWRSSGSGH